MSVSLIIDGIEVPIESLSGASQTLTKIKAGTLRRLASGAAHYMTAWSGKWRTSITGGGWSSSGLASVDFTGEVVIKCMQADAVRSVSNTIALPVNRRSDVAPVGYAIVGGKLVATDISDITDNIATLDTVSGASGYKVDYWPEITIIGGDFEESVDANTGAWSWSLTGEEV